MDSIALPSHVPERTPPSSSTLPELSDSDYVCEVLGGKPEHRVKEELLARASMLGIDSSGFELLSDSDGASIAPSDATATDHPSRSGSVASEGTASTGMTSNKSITPPSATEHPSRSTRRKASLSFSLYEKYLSQLEPNLPQPKYFSSAPDASDRPASVFSLGPRMTVRDFRRGIATKLKLKLKPAHGCDMIMVCVGCREDLDLDHEPPQTLPCGHTYCRSCILVMTNQSMTDESKMPPRCCTQPLPASILRCVLLQDDQRKFLGSVLQYSTPWESRVFCPNRSCGGFIPPRDKVDPKHPSQVQCRSCKTKVCIMCKEDAHELGRHCPEDVDLSRPLRLGDKSGWRRCYKCRSLVEPTRGCAHMTCRCKAQFCYACGAVWDPFVGCPNFCGGEEDLERRGTGEEEDRLAEFEVQERTQKVREAREEARKREADVRSHVSPEFKALRQKQTQEMERFQKFEHKMKWLLWNRQSQRRLAVIERYVDLAEKMKDRHAKAEQSLEDRQLEAEMDMRTTLEQSEKKINIQLKHMEAFCNGLGRSHDGEMPDREITQKHLEQLGQQYNLRDGMERRHKAQINVLREKQTKAMEDLADRQEVEMERLVDMKTDELERLELEFSAEADALARGFTARKARVEKAWLLAIEILRQELQRRDGLRYELIPPPLWPLSQDDGLPSVREEVY